jgi:ubiquinone/menaquinone biosynthesis C-methylase UbiE
MKDHSDTYIPALSHDSLTPLYDTFIKWTMPESTFKREVIEHAQLTSKQRVLDLGCGTATLTILAKQMHPDTTVIGIDGDWKVLKLGRSKAEKTKTDITFTRAMAFELPYSNGSFDCVVSSLMFHHLTTENKIRSLTEVHRVLRSGGELHIADFGKPRNLLMRMVAYPWHLLEGPKTTNDNVRGLLPQFMRDSGFVEVREAKTYMTLFGTLSLYAARKAS